MVKIHMLCVASATLLFVGCSGKDEPASAAASSPPAAHVASGPDAPAASAVEPGSANADPIAGNASAAAGATKAPAAAASPYLTAENGLLIGNELSVDKASATLQSDKGFEQALRQFHQNAANNRDAQDLAAHYKQAIERGLQGKPGLQDFSCGLSLCIGSMRTRSADDYKAWSQSFAKESGAPTYNFMELTKKLGDGEYESRFVFSTDPAANSVSIAARPK